MKKQWTFHFTPLRLSLSLPPLHHVTVHWNSLDTFCTCVWSIFWVEAIFTWNFTHFSSRWFIQGGSEVPFWWKLYENGTFFVDHACSYAWLLFVTNEAFFSLFWLEQPPPPPDQTIHTRAVPKKSEVSRPLHFHQILIWERIRQKRSNGVCKTLLAGLTPPHTDTECMKTAWTVMWPPLPFICGKWVGSKRRGTPPHTPISSRAFIMYMCMPASDVFDIILHGHLWNKW